MGNPENRHEEWAIINELAQIGQGEDEASVWDEWAGAMDEMWRLIDIQRASEAGIDIDPAEYESALAHGIVPVRVNEDDDSYVPLTPHFFNRHEDELLPLPATNMIRRAMSVVTCWFTRHANVIVYIDYLQPGIPPTQPRAIHALSLSSYVSPRVLAFSLQCVRCGWVGVDEMIQATNIPPQIYVVNSANDDMIEQES